MAKDNKVTVADIRLKTDKELETRVMELRKEQFNLRFQKATGQLANTARVTAVRKEIAKDHDRDRRTSTQGRPEGDRCKKVRG